MITVLAFLVITFFLAFFAEAMTEYIFGNIVNNVPVLTKYKWLMPYLALGVGVGFAFNWHIDLVYLLGCFVDSFISEPTEKLNIAISTLGILVTGFGIGRGANWLHEAVKKVFQEPE